MAADTKLLGIGYRHIKGGEDEFDQAGKKIRASAKDAAGEVSYLEKVTSSLMERWNQMFSPATMATTAIAAFVAIVISLSAAMAEGIDRAVEFEKGLLAVGKTADLRGTSLTLLGEDIDALSRRLPTASAELLEVAQSAGSLGVTGSQNILAFTETLAKLGSASDLAGEEGAAALAEILSVTGEASSTVPRLAAVIVALGNAFAATESQIAHHTGEVARSTAIFDVSAAQAAALGTVLASFGVRAELSGSAIGRTMRLIEDAVKSGGSSMRGLEATTGRTAAEFKEAWRKGPLDALDLFLKSVKEVIDRGGNVGAMFDRLGLGGEEVLKVIPVLAKEIETLGRAQRVAGQEVANATALERESSQALTGVGSQLEILGNQLGSATMILGNAMLPAIRALVGETQGWIEGNRSAVEIIAKVIGRGASAGITGMIAVIDNLGDVLHALVVVLVAVGAAMVAIKWGAVIMQALAATQAFILFFNSGSLMLGGMLVGFDLLVVGIKTAWARITTFLAANPFLVAAIAIGILTAAVAHLTIGWYRNKEATEEYHRVLASGRAIIDGEVQQHESLAEKLREEIELRQKLAQTVDTTKERLAQLEPILRRAMVAVDRRDSAGLQGALKDAEALGIKFQDVSRDGSSAFSVLAAEVERMRQTLKKSAADQEVNALAVDDVNERIRAGIAEEVKTQKQAIAERIALIEQYKTQATDAALEIAKVSEGPVDKETNDLLKVMRERLENIHTTAMLAASGLRIMQAELQGLQTPAWERAVELMKQGEFEAGVKVAKDAGIDVWKIDEAEAAWRQYTATQKAAAKAEEERRRSAEEAALKSKREQEQFEEMLKRHGKMIDQLRLEERLAYDVARAYREGTESGRLKEGATDRELRALQAAVDFEGKYGESIRRRVQAQIDAQRYAVGEKALVGMREQIKAAQELGTALGSGLVGAAEAVRRRQQMVAAQASATTGVFGIQAVILRALIAQHARLAAENSFAAQIEPTKRAAEQARELNEVWEASAETGERRAAVVTMFRDEQALANEITGATIALTAEEAKQVAALILQRTREQALSSARGRLDELQREGTELRRLLGIRRDQFSTEKDYQTALRQSAIEERVRTELASVAADRARALAAVRADESLSEAERAARLGLTATAFDQVAAAIDRAIRKNAKAQQQLDANGQTLTTTSQKWSAFASAMQDGIDGASDEVNKLVTSFGGLVQALVDVTEAVDNMGRAQGWADAASAIAGIAEGLGMLDNNVTKGGFGGSGEGNYASEGAVVGAIIGAIIGSFWGATAAGAQIGAAAGSMLGSMIKKGADEALAEIEMDQGAIVALVTKNEGSLGNVLKDLGAMIHDGLLGILDRLGGTIGEIPKISAKVRDGVISVFVGSMVRRVETMEEAAAFAVSEILKRSKITGLSETIRTVLQNTDAIDLEQLAADLDFGQWYERLGLRDAAVQLMNQVGEFRAKFRQAIELGLDTAPIGEWLGRQLGSLRNSVLGIQETTEESVRRNAESFNAQLALTRAESELKRLELLQERSRLQAQIQTLMASGQVVTAEMRLEEQRIRTRWGIVEAEAQVLAAEITILSEAYEALRAIDYALRSIDLVLGALPDLISEGEIQDAIGRIGQGGGDYGGGGESEVDRVAADRERLLDMLAQRALDRAGEYAKALAEINKRWDDAIPLAHEDAELLRRIAAERAAEAAALRAKFEAEAWGRVDDYVAGDGGDGGPFQRLEEIQAEARAVLDRLADDWRELGLDPLEVAIRTGEILRAERTRIVGLVDEVIDDLGLPMDQARRKVGALSDTIDFLRRMMDMGIISAERFGEVFGGIAAQAQNEILNLTASILEKMGADAQGAEVKATLERATFLMEVAHLNYLYAEYTRLNLLNEETARIVAAALAYINDPANWPDFSPGPAANDNQPATGGGGANDNSADEADRRRQEILARMEEWNNLGSRRVTGQLAELNEEFERMRREAPALRISIRDLEAAYANAVRDFWDETLAPWEESTNVRDGLRDVLRQFDEMIEAQRLYGGDLERIERARTEAVRRFWDEALGGLRAFRDELLGGSMGGTTPAMSLDAATRRFEELAARALQGDREAIDALPSAVQTLLDVARNYHGTGPIYQALFARVMAIIDQILAMGGEASGLGTSRDEFANLPSNVIPFPGNPTPAAPPTPPPFLSVANDDEDDRGSDTFSGMAGRLESERRERRDDRRKQDELRDAVAALLESNRQQAEMIDDLRASVERLANLIEANERRRSA